MSISNFLNKIKGKINVDKFTFLYLIIIICVAVSSFCLGRISISINNDDQLNYNDNNVYKYTDNTSLKNEISTDLNGEKKYVASKNGKMYYSQGCSGAKRIKPENEIWFNSKEEAEKSGYALSSLCK